MKVLKQVLMGVGGAVVILIVVSFVLPRHVTMERSTVIAASPEVVYALIVTPRSFNSWSPWYGLDPDATYTYAGPERGVGASMSWTGNRSVGVGSQTVTAADENRRVVTELDFGPRGSATATFTLTPEGDGTRVSWGFETDLGMNPMSRWFGLMMERMLGPHYEEGLANLKLVAESPERGDNTTDDPGDDSP